MVAMNTWPTDGAAGSVANEAKWRKMARYWAPTGVLRGVGGDLAPSFAGGNVTVQAGACWVDGHFCELTGSQVVPVTTTGLVVVRFDPVANTAELLYRDAATTPTMNPTGTYELVIAKMATVMTDYRPMLTADGTLGFPSAAARDLALPTPARGLTVFMLDVFQDAVYYGATTGWQPPWGDPWGTVAASSVSVTSTPITSASETVLSTGPTFATVPNRRTRITFMTTIVGSAPTDLFDVRIRETGLGGNLINQERYVIQAANAQGIMLLVAHGATLVTSLRYAVTVARIAGAGNIGMLSPPNTIWIVEDVGPALATVPTFAASRSSDDDSELADWSWSNADPDADDELAFAGAAPAPTD